MYTPTLEQVSNLAPHYNFIPISYQMPSDMFSPIGVLKALKNISTHCFLLESVENSKMWGRYTFLGFDPLMEITCNHGEIHVKKDSSQEIIQGNPNAYLKSFMNQYKSPTMDGLPPFTGGLVGYFSYDYIKYSEPSLHLDAKDEENFNDIDLMLFHKLIVFDNLLQRLYLIININPESLPKNYNTAISQLEEMKNYLLSKPAPTEWEGTLKSELKPLFNRQQYCQMVERGKKHIYEGDIFQVVLSNRLEAEFEGSLLNTYRTLRSTNPSPYMFYFGSDKMEMAGASPETLVKLENGTLHTFPLAGTRKRGETFEEDSALEKELLADEKELAEHNMLVDLGRNDLGKISKFGSVTVENYQSILRFSHVMHIGSTIKSEIREGLTAIDAIEAVLPAGTLSGAPKIRACQIINTLENNKRGVYGGAIGYLDFRGNMDTCIAIRLCFQKNGKIFVRSGAGIVADSIAEKEYEECINKAKAVVVALKQSQGGF
ncbi:anthranilate synthase component I [Anaerotignum sp.]|uniref:anthranilate synthase component I n=1 Tax=Anaerotignum sp. TaxID=2039241 RepID=UPI0028A5C59F|nr:anthranilate synthase component I [Anaerotignum sp.]